MDMYSEVQIEMGRFLFEGDGKEMERFCGIRIHQVWAGTTFLGVAGFLVCQSWL